MPNLIVYNPDSPILVAWCHRLRAIAIRARREVIRKKDMIHVVSARIMEQHQNKLNRIASIRNRIRLIRRGVPLTEAFDSVTNTSQLDDNLSDADRFLLKKAYRKAASIAHPDKGGSLEDFHAVREAFLAGDLASLNEFFLLQHGTLHQRIEYWLSQPAASHVDWVRFRATNEYAVVTLYQRGKKEKAADLAGHLLDAAVAIAEREEMDLLLSMAGLASSRTTTVNNHYGGAV